MTDKNIQIRYESIEAYQENISKVHEIFNNNGILLIETKSLPPIGMARNVPVKDVEALQKMPGVIVKVEEGEEGY